MVAIDNFYVEKVTFFMFQYIEYTNLKIKFLFKLFIKRALINISVIFLYMYIENKFKFTLVFVFKVYKFHRFIY